MVTPGPRARILRLVEPLPALASGLFLPGLLVPPPASIDSTGINPLLGGGYYEAMSPAGHSFGPIHLTMTMFLRIVILPCRSKFLPFYPHPPQHSALAAHWFFAAGVVPNRLAPPRVGFPVWARLP